MYQRNVYLLFISSLLSGLTFYLPYFALYLQKSLVSTFSITLVFAFNAISILVLEIPTGIIGDKIGRKATISSSYIFHVLNVLILIYSSRISHFLIAGFISAIGYTLSSGTSTAYLYENTLMMEDPTIFKRYSAIHSSLWPVGAGISSFVGGFMIGKGYTFLFLATVLFLISAFIISLFLKDLDGGHNLRRGELSKSVRLIITNRQLKIIFIVGFFSYTFGEVTHQLKPIYLSFKRIDLAYFGLIFGITFALSFIGSLLSAPISNRIGNKRTLIVFSIIPFFFNLSSYLTSGLLSGVLLAIPSVSWGIRWPVLSYLSNTELDNENRASVLSIVNAANQLGFVLASPILGYFVDLYDINQLQLVNTVTGLFLGIIYLGLKDRS